MTRFWFAEIALPFEKLAAAEELLGEDAGVAVTSYEVPPPAGKNWPDPAHAPWRLQVLFDAAPDEKTWRGKLEGIAKALKQKTPDFHCGALPDRDWVSHTNRLNAPIHAGRFYLHGTHDVGTAPPGSLALLVEAGLAFGTGRAPSTFGCLLAIDKICRRRRPASLLDLGTGSGVLAMAGAKAGARNVLAADIDPVAVQVAKENCRANGIGPRMRCLVASRADDKRLAAPIKGGRHDLVVANILAEPLARMAGQLSRRVAPGGHLVLSGLLSREERLVASRYRARRLIFAGRICREGWSTLIFKRAAA